MPTRLRRWFDLGECPGEVVNVLSKMALTNRAHTIFRYVRGGFPHFAQTGFDCLTI